jgi:hypothetical protein
MIRRLPVSLLILIAALSVAIPAHADGLSFSLIGALDGGPTIGVAVSYPVAQLGDLDLWADAGLKREESSTAALLGLSTPAVPLLARLPLIRALVSGLDDDFPANARLGAGLLSTGEPIGYLAYAIEF